MMNEMVYIPRSLLLELVKSRERLLVILDYVNREDSNIDQEAFSVLCGFELKELKNVNM